MVEKRHLSDLPMSDRLNNNDLHRNLESLSLVSKRLLSITNRLRSNLNITDETIQVHGSAFPKLFRRFYNLKRIDFVKINKIKGDIDGVIRDISRSGLKLEVLNISNLKKVPHKYCMRELGAKMGKSLKVLICANLGHLYDKDVIGISSWFPNLEDLDISNPGQEVDYDLAEVYDFAVSPGFVSNEGMEVLSQNLTKLRRINISGNNSISDKALISLSNNCALLTEIIASDCLCITQSTIGLTIRKNPNLVSLSLGRSVISSPDPDITVKNSLCYAKALNALDFSEMKISDEFLLSIGEASLPLKKLVLSRCEGYTSTGILLLLHVYTSLKYLDLNESCILTDDSIKQLSRHLHDLTFINLNGCSNLTNSTFSTLVMSCRSLEEIHMERTSLGKEELIANSNPRITSLKLGGNKHLDNKALQKIGCICPKLRLLDISNCVCITDGGLSEIGKSCCEITEIEVSQCLGVRSLGSSNFPKLEVLRASETAINDEGLSLMKQSCKELFCLDLGSCKRVTEKGVELLCNFKRLREVSLKWCPNVSHDAFAGMVFSRSSIRKMYPPNGFSPADDKEKGSYHRNGYILYNL
ncbi:hypothetical protein GIB67_031584 [Kingdonia uniflora]|uniref:F-box/LRR-repeat protein 15-like leucin rich repeat domain-containing protein n=1 Tax=Kingdonia uniflora TaxID=39325 RepID=A0A7J7LYA1_9MAGN|nr:hypothetical protein GIB67_031584 [Kingdonia uniflora]